MVQRAVESCDSTEARTESRPVTFSTSASTSDRSELTVEMSSATTAATSPASRSATRVEVSASTLVTSASTYKHTQATWFSTVSTAPQSESCRAASTHPLTLETTFPRSVSIVATAGTSAASSVLTSVAIPDT